MICLFLWTQLFISSLVFWGFLNFLNFCYKVPVLSSSMLSEVLTPGLGNIPRLGSSEHFFPTSITHLRTASSLLAELLSLTVMLTDIFRDWPPVLLAGCLCLALDVQPHTAADLLFTSPPIAPFPRLCQHLMQYLYPWQSHWITQVQELTPLVLLYEIFFNFPTP